MVHRPNRHLQCYDCGETKRLKVSSGTSERRRATRDGRNVTRVVANVECSNCGNEWKSAHPEAIEKSRKRDASRNKYHKNFPRNGKVAS